MARHCTHGGVAQWFLLIPVCGVDDAESRVREQVGEEKIGGNGDGMILRHTQHLTVLSHTCKHHVQSAHEKNARMRACGEVFSVQRKPAKPKTVQTRQR